MRSLATIGVVKSTYFIRQEEKHHKEYNQFNVNGYNKIKTNM